MTSQLIRTRRLARAFQNLEAAEALVARRRKEFDAEFGPWSAGRSVSRTEAREHLASTGFLERKLS
jgi:hypothetical protein